MPPSDDEAILFLRLHIAGDRAELIEARRVPGRIGSPPDRRGAIEVAVSDAGGAWKETVRAEDPCLQRYEFEDPANPGRLTWIEQPRTDGELHVRLPARMNARHLSVARILAPTAGPTRSLASPARLTLGDFDLAFAPDHPSRSLEPQGIGQPPTNSVPTPNPVQPIVVTLANRGPSAHRIDVTFLAEGFRTNELSAFTNRASAVFKELLRTPPYADYTNHFNAIGLFVPSAESGADHPSRNLYRDTYFGASYDSSGINRLITLSSEGRSRAFTLLREQTPSYDLAVVLVNDQEYGGSGGSPLVVSMDSRSPLIAVHEIGHSYAGLGDEYEEAYPGYPDTEEPNTTTVKDRHLIKWRAWIEDTTPVPTPAFSQYNAVVGLFEGAHYHARGWFRPKLDCGMRNLGSPFCEVCAEQLILETHRRAGLVEATQPDAGVPLEMPVSEEAALLLAVSGVQPTYQPLQIAWEINGRPVSAADGPGLALRPNQLGPGTNQVTARLRDATPRVRTDLHGRLQQFVSWSVTYAATPPTLQLSRLENTLRLRWVESATSYQLESASTLAADAWQPLTDPPGVEGSTRFMEVPITGEARFYRLRSK